MPMIYVVNKLNFSKLETGDYVFVQNHPMKYNGVTPGLLIHKLVGIENSPQKYLFYEFGRDIQYSTSTEHINKGFDDGFQLLWVFDGENLRKPSAKEIGGDLYTFEKRVDVYKEIGPFLRETLPILAKFPEMKEYRELINESCKYLFSE